MVTVTNVVDLTVCKLVNMWSLDGGFIIGGIINYSTYMDYVRRNRGNEEKATQIWNDACAFSQPHYAMYVRIQVQKVC